jgi:hypothetical protein
LPVPGTPEVAQRFGRAARKAAPNPFKFKSEMYDRKNDRRPPKDMPADSILAARRPDKDFGTSRFKGN